MKPIQIFLFTIICFTVGCCNRSQAQDSTGQTLGIIERSIADQTYIYDYDTRSCRIQNKKNNIDAKKDLFCEYFRVDAIEPLDNIFDKIFSEERKKELKGKVLPLFIYSDSSGNVLEITFRLRDISMITLEEVYALEKALLKYKFTLTNTCPGKKYYFFTTAYRWK